MRVVKKRPIQQSRLDCGSTHVVITSNIEALQTV